MAVNKVIYGGNLLIDLTEDTVDAAHLAKGCTAHDAAGNPIVGIMEPEGGTTVIMRTWTASDIA